MARSSGKVHVVRVNKAGYVDKEGRRRDYSSAYLRRTYRSEGKVKNETVAKLSALPDHVIDLIDAGLKGQQLVPAAEAVTITRSLPHGHVAAVHAMAARLGLPALLGPAGPPACSAVVGIADGAEALDNRAPSRSGRRWRPDWIIGCSWLIGWLTDMQTTHQAEHPRPVAVPHRAGRCRSLSGGHEPVRRLRDDAPARDPVFRWPRRGPAVAGQLLPGQGLRGPRGVGRVAACR
jgi:hypothetical protein